MYCAYGPYGPLPPGKLDVKLDNSPDFGKDTPSPTNTGVPGQIKTPKGNTRTGVRIHPGTVTWGCITICERDKDGKLIPEDNADPHDPDNRGKTTNAIQKALKKGEKVTIT